MLGFIRSDWVLISALLISVSLHLGLMVYKPAKLNYAFQAPLGQSMAITLGKPLVPQKDIVTIDSHIEDLITTQAQNAQNKINPNKPEPEIKELPQDITGELEELIVTREVQLSQKPIAPIYPEKSRREGQEGLVLVRAKVDELGKTHQVIVVQSSGFPLLDKAALDAVTKWSFLPAEENEQAIMAWVEVPIDFKLR